MSLDRILLNHVPFITFFIAVYLTSLLCGLGPGVFATLLSAVAGAYFIAEPRFSIYIENLGDIVQLVLFLMIAGAISVSNDRVRRQHRRLETAADELEHQNVVMSMALTAGMSGSWELNLETGQMSWDEASDRLFGLGPEFTSTAQTFYSLIHPDDIDTLRTAIHNCRTNRSSGFRMEFRMMLPKGVRYMDSRSKVDYDRTGRPVRLVGITSDITDRKCAEEERLQLEKQLREARHLESVGRLAGGVAHDFNNLLTVINGYAETLAQQLTLKDPMRTYAIQISKAGFRAADLVGQLLAFSQKQMIHPQPLDLNAFLREAEPLLQQLLGNRSQLILKLEPQVGPVMADPNQIHQVLMELMGHAREAMPDGGRVEIATTNFDLRPAGNAPADLQPGPYVRMTVTDTGVGIAQDQLPHIFEPFFNAKKLRGVGAGIGLASVYGIVRQSKGWIDVRSQLGRGTAFRIHLPRVHADTLPDTQQSGAVGNQRRKAS